MGEDKWENAVLHCARSKVGDEWRFSATLYAPEESKLRSQVDVRAEAEIVLLLNELGAEGWEVVGVDNFNSVFGYENIGGVGKAVWVDRHFWLRRRLP